MNFNIGRRILAGYLMALSIFAVVGAVAYRAGRDLIGANQWVVHTWQVRSELSNILIALLNAETGQRGYLLTGEERFLEPYRAGASDASRHLSEAKVLTADNPRQTVRLTNLESVVSQRLSFLTTLVDARRRANSQVATTADLERGKREMDELRKLIAELEAEENRLLEERQATARASTSFAAFAVVLGGIIGGAVVVILSITIQRSITKPLRMFMDFAEKVGQGDLTQRANLNSRDELGILAGYLDRMAVSLRGVAKHAAGVSAELNGTAGEILATTQQQAAATAEQAAAVQQANVTLTQLAQSGSQISDRARQVATSSETVSAAGVAGLQAVQSTVLALQNISAQADSVAENVIALSEKTQAIGTIIASVNEIAEQSHLLALNAAIQAAAAGESGRGFKTVANEMKSLAAQSKHATIQVRSILGDIQRGINSSVMLTEEAVKRADVGVQQSSAADRTIRQLTENLEESIRVFQQIAAGAAHQQTGFDQVTQAFRSIGTAAQQTASSTRQAEQAASNLLSLSGQLSETVGQYRV